MLRVDVIVDRRELLRDVQPHAADQLIHHGAAVKRRKLLCQLHVVDIPRKQFARRVRQMLRDIRAPFGRKRLERLLDLLFLSLCPECGDQRLLLVFGGFVQLPVGLLLIVSGDLDAEMPRTGVDDEIDAPVLALIRLDEMIAAAQ